MILAILDRTSSVLIIFLVLMPITFASPVEAKWQQHSPSPVTWSRTYQQLIGTDAFSVTPDGGFIVAGQMFGRGVDVWVMKADTKGDPEWEGDYHPVGFPYGTDVREVLLTRGGGYLVVATALSGGPWLFKLDHRGSVEWSRVYRADSLSRVEQTSDGGYIAAGNFGTIGAHDSNGWILKLDSKGSIVWQETFEGQDVYSIDQTRDEGYVLAGSVCICGSTYAVAAAWVLKLDRNGAILWQKAYQNVGNSGVNSILQTSDGGYLAAGGGLFLKLDSEGNILWQKMYSGGGSFSNSLHQTPDGGFVVSGRSSAPWVLKIDSKGNIEWQNAYGGLNYFLFDTQPSSTVGFVSSGWLYAKGSAWILRMDAKGAIHNCALGTPFAAILTNATLKVSNTTIASVPTSSTTTATGVNVNALLSATQTVCSGIRNDREGNDSPLQRKMTVHKPVIKD